MAVPLAQVILVILKARMAVLFPEYTYASTLHSQWHVFLYTYRHVQKEKISG